MMALRIICLVILCFLQEQHWVRYRSFEKIDSKEITELVLSFDIEEGFHIQSNAPEDPNLIASRLELDLPEGWELLQVSFPESSPFQMDGSEEDLQVYSGDLVVRVIVDTKGYAIQNPEITGVLFYQACDRMKCYFPRSVSFAISW